MGPADQPVHVSIALQLHQMNIKVGVKLNPKEGIFPYENNFEVAKQYIPLNSKGYIDFNPMGRDSIRKHSRKLTEKKKYLNSNKFIYNILNDNKCYGEK